MPTIADIRAQYPQYGDMQDNQLADALYGKFYSDMPREQFNTKIGLTQPPPQPAPAADTGNMFSDVIPEIKNAASENINAIKNMYGGTADKGVLQSQLDVGKGLMAIPGLIASPITGAARSLLGHPLASAEHAIGSAIAPEIAAKDDPQQMYEAAKGNVDTAMMGLAPRGASPIGIKTAAAPVPAAAELKSVAKAGYDAANNSGVEIKPSSIANLTAKIQADLNSDGLNEVLAPKTFGVLDKISNPPAGSTVAISDFRTMQRALGHAAGSIDPTERLAASRAMEALSNHLENLPPGDLAKGTAADAANVSAQIKEANANYKGYKQSENFSFRGDKAVNNAEAANSGMNLENQLRSQVRQILNNKNAQRGFDAETMAAFRAFNRGSRSANILRMVGNALGGGGGWGTIANAAIGHMIGGPIGAAAIPGVGLGLKMAGNARAASQFEKLGSIIRSKTPLAASRPPVALPAPNPILSILAGRLSVPQILGMGIVPSRADQQQQ